MVDGDAQQSGRLLGPQLRQKALQVAKQFAVAGLKATSQDAGPEIDKIERFWGLSGQPWCMMFVLFCLMKALAFLLGKGTDDATLAAMKCRLADEFLLPSSSCGAVMEDAKARGIWKSGYTDLQPGDLVLYCWDGSGRPEHVGICGQVRPGGTIVSVEGNTEAGAGGDQSEGHGAFIRVREFRFIVGRVRIGG